MGQRGPRALPANVHRLRGASHLAKDALRSLVEPDIEIPDCPPHLLPAAKKFWKTLTPELEKLGLVATIDQAMLSIVCQEWALLVWFDRALARDFKRLTAAREAFEKREEQKAAEAAARGDVYTPLVWAGGDGVQVQTPAGNLTYNPNWVARNKHANQLDRFLAAFGMSPSSRGKVSASTKQLDLPGMDTPKEGFGAL